MVREYARLRVSSYDDPDVEALTIEAQWLYYKVLLAHPTLSSCGVMDWRPKKLVRKGSNAGPVKILAAAAELEHARFLMFNLETEEVLLRSYVRGDELLKNPKMAGAVIKAYQAVASRELQAALVTEIIRIRKENPDYSSWSHKDTAEDLSRILLRPDLSTVGYTNAFVDRIDYGNTDVNPDEIGNPSSVENGDTEPIPEGDTEPVRYDDVDLDADDQTNSAPIPSTYTRSHKPAPNGGYETGVPHQGATTVQDDPPPKTCPDHPDGTTAACTSCRIFRRAREAHDADVKQQQTEARTAEVQAAAELRRTAIIDCGMCDDDGYMGTTQCNHDPDTVDRARRGAAQVRAVLAANAAKRTENDGPPPNPTAAPESTTDTAIEDHDDPD